jgi:hypothetical protein
MALPVALLPGSLPFECVMNHATKAIEIEDIEARVSALEASAGE